MGSVFGGGGGKSSSTQVSGYAGLPAELRDAFNPLGIAVGQYTNPANAGVINRFTPLAQTADETAAIDRVRQGFAPTQQSIASDVAMQMNPFDQYVIDGINREAQGQSSILRQNMAQAGQFGSNRGMLGANDIDLSRLQQIGQFKQGQYNTSLNNAINTLPQQRAADAEGMMGIGNFQRGLNMQTNLAPIAALQAGTGMIAPFTAGGVGNSSEKSGGSGILGGLGSLASGLGTASSAYGAGGFFGFSDERLKQDIFLVGEKNGYNIYEFAYTWNPAKRYRGVLAQEIEKVKPEAIREVAGYMAVDYEQLGFRMEAA